MAICRNLLFSVCLLLSGCLQPHFPQTSLELALGERRIFDYQDLKINYYEAGQGRPVLLLHGFGACAYSWRFLAPALAREHRVIALDLKGCGLSDKPRDGKYAVSDQADMVAAFIKARELHDLAVVGHSMGGAVALLTYFQVQRQDPARLRRLVLIDSAGYPQKLPWFIWLARLPLVDPLLSRLLSARFAAALVLKKCFYDKDKVTAEMVDTYAFYGSLPGAREAVLETARQIVPADWAAVTARYKTINIPVLIIWGEEDTVVPLQVGRHFRRDIPDSQLVVIPNCGHIPPEEDPGETTRLVEGFLKKN
jgi:pimeloyl-ACP methyl ester carboxylesterase